MSQKKFAGSSIFLFLDIVVIAASSWFYWLVISKLISASDIGQTSAIYSLVFLVGAIVGLGLEYPLLKSSNSNRIFGSSLIIELIITATAIPLMLFILNELQNENTQNFTIVAIAMLISVSVGYIARYALLGISASRAVLIIDTVSVVFKFVTGYILVTLGFGALGVLISFMLQALIAAFMALYLATRMFGLNFNMPSIKEVFKEGTVNIPSIFSRTLVVSLSVVLLASFGVASSQVGVFYIALMISVLAGGLISSAAYMVIPASALAKKDLTTESIRMGTSLTAPIIALLLAEPNFILSLIGTDYTSGHMILMILTLGILPFAISTNAISRLNYLGKSKRLLFVGLLQVLGFLVGFIILVPAFSAFGAALSILISYSISSVPAILWSEKIVLRYIANTAIAVVAGWSLSSILKLLLPDGIIDESVTLVSSFFITAFVIFALKNTSVSEVKSLVKNVIRTTK